MAATARVIWLCVCVRYWPDCGLVFEWVTWFYCFEILVQSMLSILILFCIEQTLENEPLQCDIHSCVSLFSHRSWLFPTLALTKVGRVVEQFNTRHRCRMMIFLALYHPKDGRALKYRIRSFLVESVLRYMVNKSCVQWNGILIFPPALSSYRHARLVECGIDTQNRLSRVMFCLRYVNFRSLSHKPLLIQYPVNNKRVKNERNIQLVIFFCVTCIR